MMLSPELEKKFIDPIVKSDKWDLAGVVVDDKGAFAIYAQSKVDDRCITLIQTPRGSMITSCEEADEMYCHVCVKQKHCTKNPYVKGNV